MSITAEATTLIRVRGPFRSGIALSILLYLSSDALRDRIEGSELVRDPTTLHGTYVSVDVDGKAQHTFRFSLDLG